MLGIPRELVRHRIVELFHQEDITERIVEQIADEMDHARVSQIQQQIVEVALDIPQERVQQSTTEQVVDVPVPLLVEEIADGRRVVC